MSRLANLYAEMKFVVSRDGRKWGVTANGDRVSSWVINLSMGMVAPFRME